MAWVRVSHKSPDHIAARYLYAGYGSNLNLEQMTRRCPGADLVGAGILRNARLVFAYHLGIVQDDAATVPIGVMKVTAADVAALDRYEALGRQYERILVTVECNGQAVRCFTYLKKDNALEAPSGPYYETCLQGYNDWAFDSRRLRHAREKAIKEGKPMRAPRGRAPYAPDAGTYRSDEPLGSGTAASYRGARSPRPEGGRLGGADFVRPRIDERASLADFKRAIESGRVPTQSALPGALAGATATGRDGQKWIAMRGRDGHLTWKRQGE
jgi:hypothetical protein